MPFPFHFGRLKLTPGCDVVSFQCYQWLKEKIISEEGRKQQTKLKDLSPIAERLGCTLPQLAVGKRGRGGCGGAVPLPALVRKKGPGEKVLGADLPWIE